MTGPSLYVTSRTGPPGSPVVIAAHGTLDRASSFTRLARELPEVELVCYDRRGYDHSGPARRTDGGSHARAHPSPGCRPAAGWRILSSWEGPARLAGGATLEEHIEDLVSLVDLVLGNRPGGPPPGRPPGPTAGPATGSRPTPGPRCCILLGHSFGGLVALGAAARRPEQVRGVLAYEPPAPWEPWWPRAAAEGLRRGNPGDTPSPGDMAERFISSVLGPGIAVERLGARWLALRREEGTAMMTEVASLRSPSAACALRLHDIEMPVLLATGSRSEQRYHAAAATLAAGVAHAEVVRVEGASHPAHLSHPAELAALARGLLQQACPVGATS
ncbi:MAG: alpha/beta fold hydrolase [Acidimicrobiales bacterium]